MVDRIYNVLFLCTGNSARSIMAEAVLNSLGKRRFRAFSAGSHPAGQVHPMTLDILKRAGFQTAEFRSKPWEEFSKPDAPVMDFVFTVCDRAASEVCPVWPGQPLTAHWGFEDPVLFEGSHAEQAAVFAKVFREIQNRVAIFLALPIERLSRFALKREIDAIGETVVSSSEEIAPLPLS